MGDGKKGETLEPLGKEEKKPPSTIKSDNLIFRRRRGQQLFTRRPEIPRKANPGMAGPTAKESRTCSFSGGPGGKRITKKEKSLPTPEKRTFAGEERTEWIGLQRAFREGRAKEGRGPHILLGQPESPAGGCTSYSLSPEMKRLYIWRGGHDGQLLSLGEGEMLRYVSTSTVV